jgi:hypothetical protein
MQGILININVITIRKRKNFNPTIVYSARIRKKKEVWVSMSYLNFRTLKDSTPKASQHASFPTIHIVRR